MSLLEDERFMRVALETAAAKGTDPSLSLIGRCIVLDGRVVAAEANHVAEHRDATAHAEMEAIRAAGRAFEDGELRGATLYSTLQRAACAPWRPSGRRSGASSTGRRAKTCTGCTSKIGTSTPSRL